MYCSASLSQLFFGLSQLYRERSIGSRPPCAKREKWGEATFEVFFLGGNNLLHNPHTHGPTTKLLQRADSPSGRKDDLSGGVGWVFERGTARGRPPPRFRRSIDLGRGAMRRRHWCSKKLGGVGRLRDGLAAEKPGFVGSPGGRRCRKVAVRAHSFK